MGVDGRGTKDHWARGRWEDDDDGIDRRMRRGTEGWSPMRPTGFGSE